MHSDYALIAQLLDYDPATGLLIWKPRPETSTANKSFNRRFAGKRAGYVYNRGYYRLRCLGQLYLAHRVAFLLHHGRWPHSFIDHIDRNRINNRIDNLQEVTAAENSLNRSPCGEIKEVGVFRSGNGKGFVAAIQRDGVRQHLGTFKTISDAAQAYQRAKSTLHRLTKASNHS